MVVPRSVERALANEPIEIYGDGEQTRCFCHVHDTIRALNDLMTDAAEHLGRDLQRRSRTRNRIIGLADRIRDMTQSTSETSPRPVRRGLRDRDRGHAPSRAVDERSGDDRLDAGARLDDILADVIEDRRTAGAAQLSGLQ